MIELTIYYEAEETAKLSDIGIDVSDKEGDWRTGWVNPEHISAILPTYDGNTNIWLLSGDCVTTDMKADELIDMLK